MSKISEVTGNSFDDGRIAGEELLELYDEIGHVSIGTHDRPSVDEVTHVIKQLWQQGSRFDPNPAAIGFFSTVLRRKDYDASIISFWGLDNLIEYQSQWVPICEVNEPREAFQFAFWTGDYGDGDGWCYDLAKDVIRCVIVGGPETMEELRDRSYGVYDSFHYLVAHLRCSARRRGWID